MKLESDTFLFDTNQETLTSLQNEFKADDLLEIFDSYLYHKGNEYYQWQKVKSVDESEDGKYASAIVLGTRNYSVEISVANNQVFGKCTCPVDGTCKHIIAVLLWLIQDIEKAGISVKVDRTKLRSHLQAMTKDALIKILEEYAPDSFYNTLQNKHLDIDKSKVVFDKIQKNIKALFEDWDLIQDPLSFSDKLDKLFRKLDGLQLTYIKEIQELVFYVINKADELMDDGYLYQHYYDEIFEPNGFCEWVRKFTKQLSFEDKYNFVVAIEALLSKQNYDTFSTLMCNLNELFPSNEHAALKSILLKEHNSHSQQLTSSIFEIVRDILTVEEKTRILLQISITNEEFLAELITLYKSLGKKQEALKHLEKFLNIEENRHKDSEELFVLYVDLLNEEKKLSESILVNSLTACPSQALLEKSLLLMPQHYQSYILIVEKKDPEELLNYYQSVENLPEALALINRSKGIWDSVKADFFKKFKTKIPVEAQKYFEHIIKTNLQWSGDNHYAAIYDALIQIKKVNSDRAKELVRKISAEYKRRRKLVDMIANV